MNRELVSQADKLVSRIFRHGMMEDMPLEYSERLTYCLSAAVRRANRRRSKFDMRRMYKILQKTNEAFKRRIKINKNYNSK